MRRVLIAQVAWAALAVSLGLAARPAAAGLIVNRLDPSAGWDATDLPAVVLPPGVADLPADPAPIPAPDLPVEAAPVRAGPDPAPAGSPPDVARTWDVPGPPAVILAVFGGVLVVIARSRRGDGGDDGGPLLPA